MDSKFDFHIPTNEEIILESGYNEGEAIKSILSHIVKSLNLYAASALFVDEENGLFSPIVVYPENMKIRRFVKLPFHYEQLKKFKNTKNVLFIKEIIESKFYQQADIDITQRKNLSLFSMPIRYFGNFLGILNCYFDEVLYSKLNNKLNEKIIILIAEKIGVIKTRCYEERKQEYLKKGKQLSSYKSLNRIMANIIKTCIDLGPRSLKYGFCGLVDNRKRYVKIEKQNVIGWKDALEDSTLRSKMQFGIDTGITGQVVKQRKPLLLHDVDDPIYDYLNYDKSWPDVKSNLCVPIFSKRNGEEDILAVISLEAIDHYVFSQSDIELLQTFTEDATIAIESAVRYEKFVKIQDESLELGKVIDEADLLLAKGESKKVLKNISERTILICKTLANVNHSFVAIKSIEKDELIIQAITNDELIYDDKKPIPIGMGISGTAVKEKKTTKFNNKEERSRNFIEIWREPIESEIAIPIIHSNDAIGVINLESHTPKKFIDREIIRKIEDVAKLISRKIADARYDLYSREIYEKEYSIIVGHHSRIEEIKQNIIDYAKIDVPILIIGDSGTGKELVARRIHFESNRLNKPFTTISCTEIKPEVIESELFGHKKGSFTGADTDRIGKLEYSDGGTVFFDEIGDLPYHLQGKLLRVLQEKEITPIGENNSRKINIRIIAATNKNLYMMVKSKHFREDLFYRFGYFVITIPPLKERKEDIDELVNYFINKHNKILELTATQSLSALAIRKLREYHWPGNVRQLENTIISAITKASKSGNIILPEHIIFLEDIFEKYGEDTRAKNEITREHIIKELYNQKGIKKAAYKALGISRTKCESIVNKTLLDHHVKRAKNGEIWDGRI